MSQAKAPGACATRRLRDARRAGTLGHRRELEPRRRVRDMPRPASNPISTATPTGASPGAACVTQVSTIRISSCPSGVPSLPLSTSSELNPIPAPRFSSSPNPASTYQNTRYRNLNPSPKARSFLLSEAPTLVIYNAPPIIKHLDLGESEREHGQVILWHADLDEAEGESANRIG